MRLIDAAAPRSGIGIAVGLFRVVAKTFADVFARLPVFRRNRVLANRLRRAPAGWVCTAARKEMNCQFCSMGKKEQIYKEEEEERSIDSFFLFLFSASAGLSFAPTISI